MDGQDNAISGPRAGRLRRRRRSNRPRTRSEQMALVRSRDTGPEVTLRRALWRAGARYRLQSGHLPGRPDIIFPARKVAIFVHGCFWHRHDCALGNREPKSNIAFWRAKFDQNVQRDTRAVKSLLERDWKVIVIWECELTSKARQAEAVERVTALVRPSKSD